MSEFVDKLIKKMERDEKIKKELVSDEKYFTWLAKFTKQNNGGFADDNWLYFPENISKEDAEMVEKLHLFYEALSSYAEKNNIPEDLATDFYGSSVYVTYNDATYQIGYLAGQGVFFFCKETNKNEKPSNSFEFNKVLETQGEQEPNK